MMKRPSPPLRRMPSTLLAAIALLILSASAAPVRADSHEVVFDENETGAIEAIVERYLVENPEVIVRALQVLQEREELAEAERGRQLLEDNRAGLERDPSSPVGGNPQGDVTIVEFFDYRCPYCKSVAPDIAELVETDDNVRLVYKEWPILGPESMFAARAALAAHMQGRYLEFHDLVMNQRQVTEPSVLAAAEELGLDLDQLRADMDSDEVARQLDATMQLAESLGINGTPAFVVGDQLVPGGVPLAVLQGLVERSREETSGP